MKKLKYYLVLTGWIANLGVVPLLLLAAFLFAPCLTFLADLLLRVTHVFDTIFNLLFMTFLRKSISNIGRLWHQYGKTYLSDLKYLQNFSIYVKASLFICTISSHNLVIASSFQVDTVTMSRGSIQEIKIDRMQKYTVGNPEVIKVKAEKGTLLIRAISLGVSDLLIWHSADKKPKKIKVFVINKKSALKSQKWIKEFIKIGINASLIDHAIKLQGTVETENDYSHLHFLLREFKGTVISSQLKLSEKLKNIIFSKLIYDSLNLYSDDLDCSPDVLYINCYQQEKKTNEVSKYLNNKYLINWYPTKKRKQKKQFKVKLSLFQYENLKGSHFSLGVHQAGGILKSLIDNNPLGLIENNNIALNKSDFLFSTLAEPTVTGRFSKPIQIKLGSEIPYVDTNNEGNIKRDWKFAGLDIQMSVIQEGNNYIINYKNGISHPGQQSSIQSNSQESSIRVKENQSQVMFEIGYLVNNSEVKSMPGLDSIPILRHLFSSRKKQKIYKKVIGIITVKEIII
jgi:Flp pilus assembly secretin CpaC